MPSLPRWMNAWTALLLILSAAAPAAPLACAAEGPAVSVSRAEYEALKRDAEAHRRSHSRKGMGGVLFTVRWFGLSILVTWWKILGWSAALMFAGRWLVQMYASRKAGRPVFPRVYWIVSMTASVMLLSYWIFSPQRASVGVLQNLFPVFVAGYNLYLDIRYRRTYGCRPEEHEEKSGAQDSSSQTGKSTPPASTKAASPAAKKASSGA